MNQTKELEAESIGKLLFKFSVPAITGMIVNALYNIVDRIYIGHINGVGSDALSGLAITFPISVIIMAFGMLVGMGASAVISIRLGEGNNAELINLGSRGLRIDLIVLPILGFQILGASYFQAINEAKTSMILSILRQVIVLIPLILILPIFLGLDGLWFSQPCADIIATVLTAFFLFKSIEKFKHTKD